jgi:hypothetical protein
MFGVFIVNNPYDPVASCSVTGDEFKKKRKLRMTSETEKKLRVTSGSVTS